MDDAWLHPAIIAGVTHHRLAWIHPFLDGNGRTARMLTTLILYQRGYDFKYLFNLSEYYNKDRDRYYEALRSADRTGDYTDWLEYFMGGLANQMVRIEERAKGMASSPQENGREANGVPEEPSTVPNSTPIIESGAALPRLVVHADWGSDPRKRWMCVATRSETGYVVDVPELVGDLGSFWQRLQGRAGGAGILVGFDFPIGLPAVYARLADIQHFTSALADFGTGSWTDFYHLAESTSEIGIHRPFYPYRPGGTKQDHLTDGLGISEMRQLLRRCELPTSTRGAASPLFWTLGGKQVGRAAIIGWRDLLGPALSEPSIDLRLWPFDGELEQLIGDGSVVAAETYPAEACTQLGLSPPGQLWSKTSQTGRAAQADQLVGWIQSRQIGLADDLTRMVRDGFGPDKAAEDPFDAVIGLLGMLEVVLGGRPDGAPADASVRNVEGWILGQSP